LNNGDSYRGPFVEGKKHGKFTTKLAVYNFEVDESEYRHGKLFNGKGSLNLHDGKQFVGTVRQGIPTLTPPFSFSYSYYSSYS